MTEGKLTGSLDALSLPGLLQILSAEGRTGRLEVDSGSRGGSFWLDAGHLVHAMAHDASSTSSGQDALDALLGLSDGDFTFSPGEAAPQATLAGPTEQLLMEAAVRRDHGRREGGVTPQSVPAFAPVPAGGTTPRFTTLQWRVLASIDGRKSVEELSADVQLPVTALCVLLAELEAAGVIEIT